MKNKNVQTMVNAIETLLQEAKVVRTSKTYVELKLGEGDERIKVDYDRKYQSIIVSMVEFGEYCNRSIRNMMLDKIKAYENENVELTDLRRQKEELERRIATLEQI